jgi:DNA-binding NarL/FixJ family response regulator
MVAAGDLEAARAAGHELERIGAAFDTEALAALAAQARGAVQLAEGDAPGAMLSLRRALAVWQRVAAPYRAARLRVLIARACRAVGDQDGAALELGAARAVFERLGAVPDLRQQDALSSKTSAPGQVHGLSPRELEVLRLVAAGKTNKAIAKQLFLSEKTVDRHVSNIFVKIDVASRAAATAFAYQHELV